MLSISEFDVSIEKRMKRGKLTLDSCTLFILYGLHDGEDCMSGTQEECMNHLLSEEKYEMKKRF